MLTKGELVDAFLSCRAAGLNIGYQELTDASLVLAGSGQRGDADLARLVASIWAGSQEDLKLATGKILNALQKASRGQDGAPSPNEFKNEPRFTDVPDKPKNVKDQPVAPLSDTLIQQDDRSKPKPITTTAPAAGGQTVTPIPISSAKFGTRPRADDLFPLTARQFRYSWRQLRAVSKAGPEDQIDPAATVDRFARMTFLDRPVFSRRDRNASHMVVLIERRGSMTPFHRFCQALADSLSDEVRHGRAEIYYFEEVPDILLEEGELKGLLYGDPALHGPVRAVTAFARSTQNTSLLIVSDCGAARPLSYNDRRKDRTIRFLASISSVTGRVVWLNPTPRSRWVKTTAAVIASIVPMFDMQPDGLRRAVSALRRSLRSLPT